MDHIIYIYYFRLKYMESLHLYYIMKWSFTIISYIKKMENPYNIIIYQ